MGTAHRPSLQYAPEATGGSPWTGSTRPLQPLGKVMPDGVTRRDGLSSIHAPPCRAVLVR